MDLNLRQLRAFAAVAELKSFTRAAALLHLSQPALTVQIRKLEESLHCRLLDRTSRTVDLTRIGHDLLPTLRRTLQELDAVVARSHEQGAGRVGTLRIACLPSFAASLLPDAILACRTRTPGITFLIRDAVAGRVMQLVKDEEVDLGITGGALTETSLEVLHAVDDRLCVVVPAGHPLARRRRVRIEHLVDLPLVLTDPLTSVRAAVDAAFLGLGRTPQVSCEATYMTTAVAMVRAGLGVTILPESAREIRTEPGLVARPIADDAFIRRVSIVKKRQRSLPPAAEAFLSECKRRVRDVRIGG
ncbi:MAG: LysR family transcriptional regulator [Vitreoscilla sp.]